MNLELLLNSSVLFAAFGAFATQLLTLIGIKDIPKAERPDFKDPFFWLPFLVTPFIGGGLAFAYVFPSMEMLKPLVALNVGVSAPLMLKSMTNYRRPIDPGDGA